MKNEMTRRDMGTALAAFAALGGLMSEAAAQDAATSDLTQSKVYRFNEMSEKKNADGVLTRATLEGNLPTGEHLEVHETMLPPGKMPHPAHKHRNSELILIREGKIEYQNEGKLEYAGPGDILFNASGKLHGLKNAGTTNASYFVVSVGVKVPM